MNEIRVQDLLHARYNVRFLGLVHKITNPILGRKGTPCCYSNKLAARPPGQGKEKEKEMRLPLREKIQNAINHALLQDAETGAVLVAGRRRNRKKKKNKKSKNKQQKKHDKQWKTQETNQKHKSDEAPLIANEVAAEQGEAEEDDEEDDENKDDKDNEMPFDFFKKKAKEAPAEDSAAVNAGADTADSKTPLKSEQPVENGTAPATAPKPDTKTEEDASKKAETPADQEADGGTAPASKTAPESPQDQGQQGEGDAKAEGEAGQVKQMDIKEPRSENSPLIEKESKLKDSQPGFLCCTIL